MATLMNSSGRLVTRGMKFHLVMASALSHGSGFAHLPFFKAKLPALLIFLAALLAAPSLRAQTAQQTGTANYWTGGTGSLTGGNGTWSSGTNWSTGAAPTTTNDAEFLTSSSSETVTITGTQAAQGLYFDNTTAGMLLGGGGTIQLGSDGLYIASGSFAPAFNGTNSTNFQLVATQTWNNASSNTNVGTNSGITFTSDSAITTPITITLENTGSGSWDFKGAFVNNNVTGSNTGSVAVIFNVTSGGMTLETTAANSTNTGGDTLENGSITLKAPPVGITNTSSPLGLGTLTFGTGSTASNQLFINATANYIFSNPSVVLTTGDSTTIDENGATVVATFSGVISGSGTLTQSSVAGAVLNLTNANTYSGGTKVAGGVLDINNGGSSSSNSAIGTGTFTITGGSIDNTSGSSITLSTNNSVVFGGNFSFGGTNNLNFGTGTVSDSGSRTITLNTNNSSLTFGPMVNTLAGANTLTVNEGTSVTGASVTFGGYALSNSATSYTDIINGSGIVNITGTVSNGGTATASGLTYSGTGELYLSGANTYTGTTTITGGTLEFGNETALYNDNTAGSGWTAADLVVSSGATAAFAVGGTGQFSSSDLNTLLALGTSSGGFKSGSIIGLDTTGGNFSYGNAITNTNSNAYTVGLTKLGANTLTLTGASTYTGTTTVNGGTLTLSDTTAKTLGGTAAVAVNSGGTLLFGTTDTINHSATVALGGGTLSVARTGSLNSTLGNAETMGALTLSARSTIDFGSGTSGDHNELIFSTFSAPGTVLTVSDWLAGSTYSQSSPSDTGSNDELLFGTGNGSYSLSTGQLAEIQFYVNGSEYQAIQFNYNGYDEVAPGTVVVPEPSTVFAALCLLGLLGWRGRRRFQELVGRSMVTFQTSSFGYKGPHF